MAKSNLPSSEQSDSLDNVAVTRAEFRADIGEFLKYVSQAVGGIPIADNYTTQTVDPESVRLQGSPQLTDGAIPPAADDSNRIPSTSWVLANASGAPAGGTAPNNPNVGDLWVNTNEDPPVLNVWDGNNWIPTSASVPAATEDQAGIAEIATQAEVDLGTDDERFVTPLKLISLLNGGGGSGAPGFLALSGGRMEGGVTAEERAIGTDPFDLEAGNFWSAGAVAIPDPTNAVNGMSGLIRLTDAPLSWGANFTNAPTAVTAPAIVPFYVESPTVIRLGAAVGVG